MSDAFYENPLAFLLSFGLLLLILGWSLLLAIKPRVAWYSKRGMVADPNAEPSDSFLFNARLSGVIGVITLLVFFGVIFIYAPMQERQREERRQEREQEQEQAVEEARERAREMMEALHNSRNTRTLGVEAEDDRPGHLLGYEVDPEAPNVFRVHYLLSPCASLVRPTGMEEQAETVLITIQAKSLEPMLPSDEPAADASPGCDPEVDEATQAVVTFTLRGPLADRVPVTGPNEIPVPLCDDQC